MKKGTLYWITGLAGSGKTTIGLALFYKMKEKKENVIILDGDILKTIVSSNVTYNKEGRLDRAWKYAALCKELTEQGIDVICCTISMFENVRRWNRENHENYVEVFLDVPIEVLIKRNQKGIYRRGDDIAGVNVDVELPQNPDIILNNDGTVSADEFVNQIMLFSPVCKNNNSNYENYWNWFYRKEREIEPSKFARFVTETYIKAKKGDLLELGCGNGRDSFHFLNIGLKVVAVDSSKVAIDTLKSCGNENAIFICSDFINSSILYQKTYDYCYSRFTLHTINSKQQEILLKNIFKALKRDGLLFIECRSINDELYGKGHQVERNAFIYEKHFRRFIVKDELLKEVLDCGFNVLYLEEERGFAPFGEADPPIIRLVAQKTQDEWHKLA